MRKPRPCTAGILSDNRGLLGAERALLLSAGMALALLGAHLLRRGTEQAGSDASRTLRGEKAPVHQGTRGIHLLHAGAIGTTGPIGAPGKIGDAADIPTPAPAPPPASCDQRHGGVTAIQVLVRIDDYQGLIHGRNGTHEIAYGTIIATSWVYQKDVVDTDHVQLALNVASAQDRTGLPQEEPLSPGQVVEVEGEYIPASSANASDKNGPAAVLHFSHAPCGYVKIGDQVFR